MKMEHNNKTVIIIGCGLAGLAAAKKLTQHGYHVTILEARNRIGGRTWTDYSLGVPIDLGAFIIHGIDRNPITELAQQAQAKFSLITLDSIFFANHSATQEDIQVIHEQFGQLMQAASAYARQAAKDMTVREAVKAILNSHAYPQLTAENYQWKSLFLTLYTGAGENYLSARHWDEDEIMFEGGNHIMLNGYKPIMETLANGISIRLDTTVTHIRYDASKINIATSRGNFSADAVLVTLPLGVLQKESVQFEPALPVAKQQSIARLKMGVLDKFVFKFPKVFWPTDRRIITYLSPHYRTIPWFHNFYYYFQQPVLAGFVAGDLACAMENKSDETIVQETMSLLREFFGNAIPDPTATLFTRWHQDTYTWGSYSYIPVGASGEDYDALAQPIANKLFFAGEATHRTLPGTTHGAYLSGLREAERIIKLFE